MFLPGRSTAAHTQHPEPPCGQPPKAAWGCAVPSPSLALLALHCSAGITGVRHQKHLLLNNTQKNPTNYRLSIPQTGFDTPRTQPPGGHMAVVGYIPNLRPQTSLCAALLHLPSSAPQSPEPCRQLPSTQQGCPLVPASPSRSDLSPPDPACPPCVAQQHPETRCELHQLPRHAPAPIPGSASKPLRSVTREFVTSWLSPAATSQGHLTGCRLVTALSSSCDLPGHVCWCLGADVLQELPPAGNLLPALCGDAWATCSALAPTLPLTPPTCWCRGTQTAPIARFPLPAVPPCADCLQHRHKTW